MPSQPKIARNGAHHPIPNATVLEIDYNRLAELETKHGVPFDKLCERAEQGATTDAELLGNLVMPSDDWITTDQAYALLGMGEGAFYSAVAHGGTYSGLRFRTRSRTKNVDEVTAKGNAKGRRGCGILFNRADLLELRRIKRALRLSWVATAKVFHAKQRGII